MQCGWYEWRSDCIVHLRKKSQIRGKSSRTKKYCATLKSSCATPDALHGYMLDISNTIDFELEKERTPTVAMQATKQPRAKVRAEKAETVRTATAKTRRLPLWMAKTATMRWKALGCRISIRHTHPKVTMLEGEGWRKREG